MKSFEVLKKVRQDIKKNIDEDYKKGVGRFFKEKTYYYGTRIPVVRRIAKKYFKEIFNLKKKEIFNLAEDLFKNKYNEESVIAVEWVSSFSKEFKKTDFKIFGKWIKKYLDNWAKCDDFCLHIMYPMIEKYPELVFDLKKWTKSKNMWVKRASAVSFITSSESFYTTKHKLNDIFEVSESLMFDSEDLVQKGYGWLLKATSICKQKEVFNFVMKHKNKMTRTALRYAIEKMPIDLRKKAMN